MFKKQLSIMLVLAILIGMLPMGVFAIGVGAPPPTSYFTFDSVTGTITDYDGTNGPKDVVIPSTIEGVAVTSIGNSAFESKSLTSVIIPDSVTSIGIDAFAWNSLTSLNIPDSVTSLGARSFSKNNLTSVTIGAGVTVLLNDIFNSNNFTAVVIPETVTETRSDVFYNNPITSITIGSGVTIASSMGEFGDYSHPKFRETYNDGGKKAGTYLYYSDTDEWRLIPPSVEDYITFDKNTGTITGYDGTNGPKYVVIPSTIDGVAVTSIGADAFKDKSLTAVTIPDGVTSIGDSAFFGNLLTSLTLPNSLTTIGDSAFAYNGLTSLVIPNSVTNIMFQAFYVNGLTSLEVPDSVTSIGGSAFSLNYLTSLTLPDSLTTLGENAFYWNGANRDSNDITSDGPWTGTWNLDGSDWVKDVPPPSNSHFLITKSAPDDNSTATDYYYVYAGTSETSLSPFVGNYADSDSNKAYSNVYNAMINIDDSAASSAILHFAATGNTLENASGTLDTGDATIKLTSGTYTIKGGVKKTQPGNQLFNLEGASIVIDDATIESADHGIMNRGDGSVNVISGTIIAEGSAIYILDSSSGNVTVNGGEISSRGTSDGNAIIFEGSGDLSITGGKLCSLAETAVYYVGAGSIIISGDLWDDIAQTGTLLSTDANDFSLNALRIGPNATSAEIKGGTFLATGMVVYTKSDINISDGLFRATSNNLPALFNEDSNITITGGTITSSNINTSFDFSDPTDIKFPGTVFSASSGTFSKVYISGGTISNTAATGYAIGNYFIMPGSDSYVYLSGTPTITGNTATVSSYNSIYANDGNGTYYTGSPVSLYYSEDITTGSTVAVSGVNPATNASLFSLTNEGYTLQLSGTDLVINEISGSSLSSILSQSITAGSEAGTSADPIKASISVANSVSTVSATDIVGATDSTVEFYGTDSTFTTAEAGSVALTAGSSTTVYVKVTAQDAVTVSYYKIGITRAAATTSSDSSLTMVLGKAISTEGFGGTVAFPIRTDINVSNSVSSVAATDIVGATDSTVVFYGIDSTFTTAEAGSVALTTGSSTTVYIKVTAQDGVTVGYYEVEIARAAATSSGGSSGGSSSDDNTSPTQPSQGTVVVIVNGESQNAGKETTTTEDGKMTVTVEVDNTVIEGKIDEAINNKTEGTQNVIQVPVADAKSDVVKVELTGDIVKKLEDNTFDVSVKRDNIEYIIPAEEFTISKVAENLGVSDEDLGDIKVEVQITRLDQTVVDKYNEVAKANGAELVFPPVAFEVVAKTTKADGTTGEIEISKFSNYVERVMEIPSGVDPSKITTGIVFNPDGTYSHVPTEVFQKDGKWYAKLNSLTNSNYSVVWNPVTVKSVENHWSKDAVNDMASRLVIFEPEEFEPNKAITRADFAEYIVRALGLYREGSKHDNKFSDVSTMGDRTLAILIASEYDIVTGYTDGSFRPDALITREEAMTMYQRAMKITKLVGTDSNRYQSYTDYKEVGSWATPYVQAVLSAHVFNGTTVTTISPKSNLTYAEAAQAIKNLLVESKLINK